MAKQELLYLKTHEWIEAAGGKRKMGISDFAQDQLGDIVYVELPEVGRAVAAGEEIAVIESCKATASVYAPLAGTVAAANPAVGDKPELVNQSPFGEGWLIELEVAADADASELMDAAAYETFCEQAEAH